MMNGHDSIQADYPDSLAFFSQKDSLHVYPVHSHARFYVFALVDGGSIGCFGKAGAAPRREDTAFAGDLVIINPEEAHSGYPADGNPYSYRALYINRDYLAKLFGRESAPVFAPPIIRKFQHAKVFDACFDLPEMDAHMPFYQTGRSGDVAEERLLLFLSRLLDLGIFEEKEAAVADDMSRFADYISARIGEKLTLDRIADECAMSKFHLVRRFKSAIGITPLQYHLQERIAKAKALLKSGTDIGDAALQLGFYDQSHFQNIFKSFTGLTPLQYLKGQNK